MTVPRAPLDEEARQRILAANDRMTHAALRVLGLAYRLVPVLPQEVRSEELEKDLIFAGLVGMIDPARAEVQPALEKARAAGIRTIMITGDYPNTARAIAESIHLLRPNHRVMTGAELSAMDDQALIAAVEETDVFARVSPEHKMRIVDALRANDEVVAMTGDGVNDAPAIKRADIGVAMGITGTDVAKETADMVLTDDNYASIVSAIEQGRVIYNNIRKFVFFLLSSNVAEIMIIFLPTLAGLPIPLTAIQLLSLNLITDGAPALALAMEKGDPDVMRVPPRPKKESILNGPIRIGILIQTITQTFATLTAFILGLIWTAQASGAEIGASWLTFLFELQLANPGHQHRRDDGLCHPLLLRDLPGLHRPLRTGIAFQPGGVLEPVDAVRGGVLLRRPDADLLRAWPADHLQHHLSDPDGMGVVFCLALSRPWSKNLPSSPSAAFTRSRPWPKLVILNGWGTKCSIHSYRFL